MHIFTFQNIWIQQAARMQMVVLYIFVMVELWNK